MVLSNDEYPFWARWYVNRVLESDITSVTYTIEEYNPSTDSFSEVDNGTIASRDAKGRWIAPYLIPSSTETKFYQAMYTPVGGSHPILSEEVTTLDGAVEKTTHGNGTETHSGNVCDPSGNPIVGALVTATPYGNEGFTAASDTTDANGDYTLVGLYQNFAYKITLNAPGYWGKEIERIIA